MTTPLPSTLPQQVRGLELRLAEEVVAARGLEVHQRAQDDPGRRRGHAADALEVRLALVAGEVLDDGAQVLGVEQRQVALVGPVEDQPERRLLRVVEVEHLAQQDRPELGQRRADRRRRALAAEAQELDGVGRRRPVVAGVRRARLRPGRSSSPGRAIPDRSPLTSASNTGHARVRELPGHRLQRLRLARAGRAGDEAVPVEHRQRDPDPRRRVDLPVDDDRAQLQRRRPRPRTRRRCAAPRTSATVSSATTSERSE